MSTRTIKFIVDVNAGRGPNGPLLYKKDEVVELEFLQASVYIRNGWAEDFYSKQKTTPVMNVQVYPHDQVILMGSE